MTAQHIDPLINPDVFFDADALRLSEGAERMLDFGAGRGNAGADYRGRCGEVVGCDLDPAVLANPFLHRAAVIEPGKPLPFPDNHFDLAISRYVLEHIDDPAFVASELGRILKPGGHFCAVTPNKYGYIALIAAAVPNSLHKAVLKKAKPQLNSVDVFPTRYRMNTEKALQKLFSPFGKVDVILTSGGSDYDFGLRPLAFVFETLHRILPRSLQTAMYVKVQKYG